MIEPIENAIMPLLPYVDAGSDIDFEEDILMLMRYFFSFTQCFYWKIASSDPKSTQNVRNHT